MNDGWLRRAVDKLSFHMIFGWFGVFWIMGMWFGVPLLYVIASLPFLVLLSVGLVTNTIEWCEDTWEYIKHGEEEREDDVE